MSLPTCSGITGLRQLAVDLWRLSQAPAAWFGDLIDNAEDIWDRDSLLDNDDEWLCC